MYDHEITDYRFEYVKPTIHGMGESNLFCPDCGEQLFIIAPRYTIHKNFKDSWERCSYRFLECVNMHLSVLTWINIKQYTKLIQIKCDNDFDSDKYSDEQYQWDKKYFNWDENFYGDHTDIQSNIIRFCTRGMPCLTEPQG
jgi:hypothetical protein